LTRRLDEVAAGSCRGDDEPLRHAVSLRHVVSLRCFAGGKLLAAPSDGCGSATACEEASSYTRFEEEQVDNERVRLRSLSDKEGRYLTVHKEHQDFTLRLGGTGAHTFKKVENSGHTYSFQTPHGYLAVFEGDTVGLLPNSETRGLTRTHFFVEPGPNMHEVVAHWIRKETAVPQCSFASLFDYGPPDTFVSHFWGHPFEDLLKSARKHGEMVAGNGSSGGRRRLWICSFANDQRRINEELGSDIDESAFRKALESKTCTAMALMFGTDGAPLQRCWCLYEILQADQRKLQLDICTPTGVVNRGGTRVEQSIDLLETCAQIDVATATCSEPEDQVKILAKITKFGGTKSMNQAIQQKMMVGLDRAMEAQADRLQKVVDSTALQDGEISPGITKRIAKWRGDHEEESPRPPRPTSASAADSGGMRALKEENDKLRSMNARFIEMNEKLRREKIQLKEENNRLQAELDGHQRKTRPRRGSVAS